jgi:hypothetical protein
MDDGVRDPEVRGRNGKTRSLTPCPFAPFAGIWPMRPLLLALALLLAAAVSSSSATAQPSALPTTQLTAGIHLITAEIATTDPSRTRGLMFRQALPPNHGMLFIFDDKAIHCMWMRNTLIPLSVAFIEDDGTIVNILDMKPHDDNRHCAARPVRYALEMTQGWFASRRIGPGSKLGRLPTPARR